MEVLKGKFKGDDYILVNKKEFDDYIGLDGDDEHLTSVKLIFDEYNFHSIQTRNYNIINKDKYVRPFGVEGLDMFAFDYFLPKKDIDNILDLDEDTLLSDKLLSIHKFVNYNNKFEYVRDFEIAKLRKTIKPKDWYYGIRIEKGKKQFFEPNI